jgi:hypothetical protein
MADTPTVLQMMASPPRDPDFNDALAAWIEADKAVDKTRQAFERAERVAEQREAELRAIYERLTGEGKSDG